MSSINNVLLRLKRASQRVLPTFFLIRLIEAGKLVSFSQFEEDVWALKNLPLQALDKPVLVEVGAYDGISYSNTALMEFLRPDSTVVLIEPSPRNVLKARRRRKAVVVQAAAGASHGTVQMLGEKAVSGVARLLDSNYVKEWGLSRDHLYEAEMRPLREILSGLAVSYIDFISIDVQGAELEVLEGMDEQTPVGCICIELEGRNQSREDRIKSYLKSRGLVFKTRTGVSEIWVNPTYPRWKKSFRPVEAQSFVMFPFRDIGLWPRS